MIARSKIEQKLGELHSPVCDDCLSDIAVLRQRQVANQICRQLAADGKILRGTGKCSSCGKTKIINSAIHGVPSALQTTRLKHTNIKPDISPDWYWEGNIVAAIVRFLTEEGWNILRVADTEIREQGVDIKAKRDNRELLVEVKGFPSRKYRDRLREDEPKKTNPSVQAPIWYAQALLKAMLLQNEYPAAQLAIGLPNLPRYTGLIERTKPSLGKLGISVLLVDEEGRVHVA